MNLLALSVNSIDTSNILMYYGKLMLISILLVFFLTVPFILLQLSLILFYYINDKSLPNSFLVRLITETLRILGYIVLFSVSIWGSFVVMMFMGTFFDSILLGNLNNVGVYSSFLIFAIPAIAVSGLIIYVTRKNTLILGIRETISAKVFACCGVGFFLFIATMSLIDLIKGEKRATFLLALCISASLTFLVYLWKAKQVFGKKEK